MAGANLRSRGGDLGRIYSAVNWSGILVMALLLALLLAGALRVRDWAFPRQHPKPFLLELLLICLAPPLSTAIFIWTRGSHVGGTFAFVAVLAVLFGLLHMLMQASGFYADWFCKEGAANAELNKPELTGSTGGAGIGGRGSAAAPMGSVEDGLQMHSLGEAKGRGRHGPRATGTAQEPTGEGDTDA